ncbi:MAG: hypothetical protein FWC00_02485 [Firmicutes bacterium]|nr:hypothetical protein [Bacillota bacterium]
MKRQNVLNRIIIVTAAQGLLWTAVAFSYGLGMFAMMFPRQMANFFDNVGNQNLSAIYHTRIFDRTDSAEDLYLALARNISANRHGEVIRLSGIWFDLDTTVRTGIVVQVDNFLIERANEQYTGELRDMVIGFINTYDTIRRGYIASLFATNNITRANEVFAESVTGVDLNRPSWTFENLPATAYDQRAMFRDYFERFETAFYEAQSTDVRARFFVDNAMRFYNQRFGGV